MQRPTPMNRLLQGDVGAGKTIVALLAALVAMENGLQVAFMAPTEILAEQHFLEPRGSCWRSRAFASSSSPARRPACKRRDLLARLAAGDIHLVVGTHALVQGTSTSDRSGSPSSTSSIASASCSARRCEPRA